jgi:hypothetical protein
MWDKLLALFKDVQPEEFNPRTPEEQLARRAQIQAKLDSRQEQKELQDNKDQSSQSVDKGTLIGFNYLKGLEDEQDPSRTRKFINLNKLLRGDYKNEQTQETTRESESDIRRKNT